jgi:branched-chain amino acid transport system permease protein
MIQGLVDGILFGSILSLGAIGLTMIMHVLRFANFSHAELLSLGAYVALVFDRVFSAIVPLLNESIGSFSITFSLILAFPLALIITGLSAVLIDKFIFRRIRGKGEELSMVFASFGVALIIRNVMGLIFGLKTQLYSDDIVFAVIISRDPLLMVKPDQLLILAATLIIMLLLHLVLTRTTFGFALRAVAENPSLAETSGVNLSKVISFTWVIGGALAAAAGIFYGLNNHISPVVGKDLVLPVFAATIVGGIGSVYGALLGGFIVGIAANIALLILPSGYSPAVPFLIIIGVLLIRPNGLFGEARE